MAYQQMGDIWEELNKGFQTAAEAFATAAPGIADIIKARRKPPKTYEDLVGETGGLPSSVYNRLTRAPLGPQQFPTWFWPAIIGGGSLVLVLMFAQPGPRKR